MLSFNGAQLDFNSYIIKKFFLIADCWYSQHAEKYVRKGRLDWPEGAISRESFKAFLKLPRLPVCSCDFMALVLFCFFNSMGTYLKVLILKNERIDFFTSCCSFSNSFVSFAESSYATCGSFCRRSY